MKKKSWFERHTVIGTILLIISTIIIVSILIYSCLPDKGKFITKIGNNNQEIEFDMDLETRFRLWSEALPTEYVLNDVRTEDVSSTGFVKGYTRLFSKNGGYGYGGISGKGTILVFESTQDATNYYNYVVNEVKMERGYTEINVAKNCFSYEQQQGLFIHKIICSRKNAVYMVSLQGMMLFGSEEVNKFSQQLGYMIW